MGVIYLFTHVEESSGKEELPGVAMPVTPS